MSGVFTLRSIFDSTDHRPVFFLKFNIVMLETDMTTASSNSFPMVQVRCGSPRGNREATATTWNPAGSPGGAAVMERAPERVRKISPRYKVLLHNDPVNSMEYVVTTLRQVVPSLSEQDAIAVMLEAHNTGVGLVIVCDLEPAEFYCETLKAKGLTSTLEQEE